MDNTELSSNSVSDIPTMLLKTNRPPTDTERAIILESMVPVNAELKTLESQIFATVAQVNILQSQLKRAKNELLRLRKTEASVLETLSDLRGTLSSFRDMPEDILREICIASVAADVPVLTRSYTPSRISLYKLLQISSGIRHIVLGTPSIWASISIHIDSYAKEAHYTDLVCEVTEWVKRAGGMALSISVEDTRYQRDANMELDPANALFDFLVSHSPRWKSLSIKCSKALTLVTRISALSTVDVPQLRSLSLHFDRDRSNTFSESTFLTAVTAPTLEHLKLVMSWPDLTYFEDRINWAHLTSLTLFGFSDDHGEYTYFEDIVYILQQTKCLSFCNITIDYNGYSTVSDGDYPTEIHLPFLQTLILNEEHRPSEHPGLLDLINAPNLRTFELWGELFKASATAFFKRSPNLQELVFYQLFDDDSLMVVAELLYHCPSLIALSLQRTREFIPTDTPDPLDINTFLQRFSQEDDVVTCPCLEHFTVAGPINMSVQTLRQFLECRQRRTTTPNTSRSWKTLAIDLRGIIDTHVQEEMLNVISEKRKEGLFISVSRKEMYYIGWV